MCTRPRACVCVCMCKCLYEHFKSILDSWGGSGAGVGQQISSGNHEAVIWFHCTNDTHALRRWSFPDGQYSVCYRRPQIDCLQTQLWPSINSFHQAEVHASPLVSLCVCVCVCLFDKALVNLHRGAQHVSVHPLWFMCEAQRLNGAADLSCFH